MVITELLPGVRAVVTQFLGNASEEQRLREHGLDEGVEVELLHRAAFGGDPIAIRIGGACVAMRRSMAQTVRVAPAGMTAAADLPVAAE